MRVLLSGGGTAGHVVPLLSVVKAVSPSAGPSRHADPRPSSAVTGRPNGNEAAEFTYVGEAGGIEERLAARAGLPFIAVETGQIRGQAPWTVARNLARILRGIRQCAAVLRRFRPDVVLITGGYVTVPVAWAAWRQHVPLLIYLPDLAPGLAIRATGRLAARIAVSFPEVAHYFGGKAVVSGYPVRPELLTVQKPEARTALGLLLDVPVLLVFGGSRGARSINRALVAALPALLPCCQVLHVSGEGDWPWVAEAGAALPVELAGRYHAFAYLHDEMVQALAAADLAVARAGASTLGEFPIVGLPSILVPYPYAGQHQEVNAAYLAERGAAQILKDTDLGEQLAPAVLALLHDPVRLSRMSRAAGDLARPDAAQNIAVELFRLAGTGTG